ncbi:MAG: glycosyltransferase family 2 protein [Fibrobacter sp.]|nr:glycosyltransferase family 2 protein [Fibrobacter sp.]
MTPSVSVIIATYKREIELESALASLRTQTFDSFEIVLVDDNGNAEWNEKVKKIADRFVENNPNIPFQYIVNSPNQGSAKTRNIGIDAANGKYITFLDDDDIYLPEKIKSQLTFMQEEQFDYSIADLELYNENGKLVDRRTRNYIKDTTPKALLGYHLKFHLTGTDTMMFTKEYLLKIGKFAPIDVGDEFYLMQRAIDGGGKFGYFPESHVKALVHSGEGGLSSGDGKIQGENALYEYKQKYFERLPKDDRKYIKMRHHAVLALAYFKMKNLFKFMGHLVQSFFTSPTMCAKLYLGRKS